MGMPHTSPRGRAVVLAFTIVALLLLPMTTDASAGTPAPTQPNRAVGVSSHLVWRPQAEITTNMRRLAASGVRNIREDFQWDVLEPAPGVYDWSAPDQLMRSAATVGVDVLAVIDYSATWASSDPTGRGSIFYPPSDPSTFARFAAVVIARYGPGGRFWAENRQLLARPLQAIEVWNEPWYDHFWRPGPDPAGYARLVEATAIAVRAVAPSVAIVAAGDLIQSRADARPEPWIGAVLAVSPNLGAYVNAWSVHPYPSPMNLAPSDGSGARSYGTVAGVRDVLAARNATRPIWITEAGWSTSDRSVEGVTEAQQAAYVRDALKLAFGDRGASVQRFYLYAWSRSSGQRLDREGNFGLLRADGTTKPAWAAFTSFARTLTR